MTEFSAHDMLEEIYQLTWDMAEFLCDPDKSDFTAGKLYPKDGTPEHLLKQLVRCNKLIAMTRMATRDYVDDGVEPEAMEVELTREMYEEFKERLEDDIQT